MAMLKFEAANTLPMEEAKQRVMALLEFWNRKYGVKYSWKDLEATMAGKAMGISIDGKLEVRPDKIAGEAADPGFLMRGPAQSYLQKKFREYLDPRRTLDELKKSE